MANPTYEEVRANPAYASIPDAQLRQAYDAKFPAAEAPSMLSRIKDFATSRPVLSTAGALGGLALAPEATIPAMLMAAAGSTGGGLASDIARGQSPTTGQMAIDAAAGAAQPLVGPALQGAGKVLRAVGQFVPKNVGFYGALSGHPSLLALRAAVAESGLPKLLDYVGTKYGQGIDRITGSLRSAAPEAAPAAETITAKSRLLPRGVEQPYRMPGDVTTPAYQPSAFSKAMAGPNPEMSVVEPSINVQTKPSMSEVDKLTQGLVRPRTPSSVPSVAQVGPVAGRVPMANAAKFTPADWQELNAFMGNGVSEAEKAALRAGARAGASPQSMATLNEIAGGSSNMAPVASHARPAGDFLHPADTSGGAFGFENLPPISEAELSRLQEVFKRVTGR